MPVPFPDIPGASRIAIKYDVAGQEAWVILGYANVTDTRPTVAQANAFLSTWATNMRNLQAGTCVMQYAELRHVVPDGVVTPLTVPAASVGNSTGQTPLPGYAALIKWASAGGGRSNKGRTYLPGVPVNALQTDGRSFTSTYKTAAASAITAVLAHATSLGDPQIAVVSTTKGGAARVVSGALAAVPGIQRRRMR